MRRLHLEKDPLSQLLWDGCIHHQGGEIRLLRLRPGEHEATVVQVEVTQGHLSGLSQNLECVPRLGTEEGSILDVFHRLLNGEPMLHDLVHVEEQQTGCLPVSDEIGEKAALTVTPGLERLILAEMPLVRPKPCIQDSLLFRN